MALHVPQPRPGKSKRNAAVRNRRVVKPFSRLLSDSGQGGLCAGSPGPAVAQQLHRRIAKWPRHGGQINMGRSAGQSAVPAVTITG